MFNKPENIEKTGKSDDLTASGRIHPLFRILGFTSQGFGEAGKFKQIEMKKRVSNKLKRIPVLQKKIALDDASRVVSHQNKEAADMCSAASFRNVSVIQGVGYCTSSLV